MMKLIEKCKNCGTERNVVPSRLKMPSYTGLCSKCFRTTTRGSSHPNWKGGRQRNTQGYILVWVARDGDYAVMAKRDGYIYEHRLIMARHLGRPLEGWEVVHHKNNIKDDNRLENLLLLDSDGKHNKTVSKIMKQLREENKMLKNRISELESLYE